MVSRVGDKAVAHTRCLIVFTAFFPLFAFSQEQKNIPEPIPAPLIRFTPDPPIELSSDNRRALKFNPDRIKQEEEYNRAIRSQRTLPWIGFVAVAAAMALLLSPKRKPKAAPQVALRDPRQEALASLNTLEQQQFDPDQLYTGLTSIVRAYLEGNLSIKATTLTTEEFLKQVADKHLLDDETHQALIAFLQVADSVKFAQYIPSEEERKTAFAAAKRIFEI